jgi:Uma2 family endonuclease
MSVATRHRFSAEEFTALRASRVLGDVPRTELLGGEIFEMTPIGDLHAGTVDRIAEALTAAALPTGPIVRVQSHIVLDEWSMPQPDITLLARREDYYTRHAPGPEDVLLVVEVATSSLAYDRDVKLPLYAAAGVPEVWIVVPRRSESGGEGDEARSADIGIHVHRTPVGRAYKDRRWGGTNDVIEVPGIGKKLPVAKLIGG